MVMLVRAARWLGWMVFIGSVAVLFTALSLQVARGPVIGQSCWPSPRLWRYFFTSLGIAACATGFAAVLALPASLALVTSRRRWQRAIIAALAILPIISMPSSHAYAWMLMATSRNPLMAGFIKLIHWNTSGAQPIQAAWALATWLWPIACLVIGASFRHAGAGAYQLASIDASSPRSYRISLAVMRGPIIAAFAAVFFLSLLDSTVPPLVGANQVWSAEMMAQAVAAMKYDRPIAFLFFQAWPMLLVFAGLGLIAWPGLRQMARWSDPPDDSDLGTIRGVAWWPAAIALALVSLLPFAVFCVELSSGRTTASQAVSTAIRTLWRSGMASLLTAVLSGLAATFLALALMDDDGSGRKSLSTIRRIAFYLLLLGALLPPELIGVALVAVYAGIAGPRDWWSLYDRTPWPWIMGMTIRFAFLSVCVGRFPARRSSTDLAAAAMIDGATPLERLVHAKLPMVRGPLLVAGIMVACLALSEVAVSILVQPPRFIGGSLAAAVDSQMHYGRQNETIAGALLLAVPAMFTAACIAAMTVPSRRRDKT